MRYIGIIILLVLCLTLLLITGCATNAGIPETTSGNLENQENTEEPVIVDTEEPGTVYPQKWSGLGMYTYIRTNNPSAFGSDVDTLLANGFTELRIGSGYDWWEEDKTVLLSMIAKGTKLIWGIHNSSTTLTSSTWSGFADGVKAAAQWAEDNGVFEFEIGNEAEMHNDDDTLTDKQLILNLKALATEVQAIFTIGNINHPTAYSNILNHEYDWKFVGRGDFDFITCNLYKHQPGNEDWKYWIDQLVTAFGADHTYLTEFGLNVLGVDEYSEDEAVQAAGVTEMIEYIKASGMTRANYFCYRDPSWISGFGARKDDGTYRQLWNQALLNSGSVESTTVPTKTTTISSLLKQLHLYQE